MLLLNPRVVRFGSATWEDVAAVAVDREAHRLVLEWGDLGPHAVFADVPEQKVTIRVVQEVARGDVDVPRPGEQGTVEFHTSPASGSAGRRRVSATAVITDVTHEVSLKGGAIRRVTLVAVSGDGVTDPVSVSAA